MFYRYHLHMIELDGTEYDDYAYFVDHFEAAEFLDGCDREGVTVQIVAPYWDMISPDDLPAIERLDIPEMLRMQEMLSE